MGSTCPNRAITRANSSKKIQDEKLHPEKQGRWPIQLKEQSYHSILQLLNGRDFAFEYSSVSLSPQNPTDHMGMFFHINCPFGDKKETLAWNHWERRLGIETGRTHLILNVCKTSLQISQAMRQWINRWSAVSSQPHMLHRLARYTPRFWILSIVSTLLSRKSHRRKLVLDGILECQISRAGLARTPTGLMMLYIDCTENPSFGFGHHTLWSEVLSSATSALLETYQIRRGLERSLRGRKEVGMG